MQIIIESPHISISPKLEKELRRKFSHLEKLYDRILKCDVVLKKEKNDERKDYSVEGSLFVPGEVLFATERESSFELALNKLISALEHQLRRHKEELEDVRPA